MKVWQIYRDVLTRNGIMNYGTESSGSSTTVWSDSTLTLTADALIGGTVFCTYDAGGASAAPEGEVFRITDNSGTSITHAAGTANAVGDEFAYTTKEFRYETLLPMFNIALRQIGHIPIQDTSITTASNQTEYTLPTAIKEGDIRGVYIQLELNDSNDNRWYPVRWWKVLPATAGSTGTLVLHQYASGYNILIDYMGLHPSVSAFSDNFHESIHPELMRATLNYVMASRRAEQAIGSVDGFNQLYNKAAEELADAQKRYKIVREPKQPRRLRIGQDIRKYVDDEPNVVRLS